MRLADSGAGYSLASETLLMLFLQLQAAVVFQVAKFQVMICPGPCGSFKRTISKASPVQPMTRWPPPPQVAFAPQLRLPIP